MMKGDLKITFLVKSGSRSAPYSVYFTLENDRMYISCSCPAGRFGKFCKHRIALIQGNSDILYDDSQDEDLYQICDWIQKSEFLDLIFERSKFKTELREAQARLDEVKRKMRPVEKKMAQVMKKGIKKHVNHI
jgi:uncharacterized Zn finger protein